MPDRLKIGDRVRVRDGSVIVDLLTCPTGAVTWTTTEAVEQIVNIDLDDGFYATGTEAKEWERES